MTRIFDKILFNVIVFVVCLVLLLNFTDSPYLSLAVSFLFIAVIELFLRASGIYKKRAFSVEESGKKKKVMNQFVFNSKGENLSFFFELCRAKCPSAEISGNYIFMQKDGVRIGLFLCFDLAPLSAQSALNCCKTAVDERLEQIYLLSAAAEDSALRMLKSYALVKANILQGNAVFAMLKQNSYFPKITAIPLKEKTLGNFIKSIINRKRFKGYFFTGLFILFLSVFTPFKLYYQVFSGFLLLLSAFCLLKNNKSEDEELPNFFLNN